MYKTIPYSPSRLDSTLYIYEFLNRFKSLKILKVLDVGSGKLYLYEVLKDLQVEGEYLGIDIDPKLLNNKSKKLKIKVLTEDFLESKINRKYDLVASLWVLEHMKKDKEALAKMSKLTTNKGLILIAVPSIWSWPFEFGRHGYRYYSKEKFLQFCQDLNLKVVETHNSGGVLGFIFMILYSWPRYLILVCSLPIYLIIRLFGYQTPWKRFSHSLIHNTWYYYHRFSLGIKAHNWLVSLICRLDNLFKVFPASYIFILKR